MKMRSKLRNIILSILLVSTMFAGVFTTQVSADTNKVNVTLHKRQYTKMPEAVLNTGGEIADFGGAPLEGVEFTAYDVTEKYHTAMKVDGETQSSVINAIQEAYTPFAPENNAGTAVIKTTNVDGQAVFEDLVVREIDGEKRFKVYVFVETKTPLSVSVTQKASPMVIAMPIYKMVDGKHSTELLTDVHLYPKNVTSEDTKVFKNTGMFTSVDVEGEKHFNVPIGARLDFEVTLNIPADIVKMTEYSLTDKPVNGLAYLDDSLVVPGLEIDTDYTFNKIADGGFEISFNLTSDAVKALAGKTLSVTYDMVLTAEVLPDSLYENNAIVSVNNEPREEMKTGPEDPKFYTHGHKFIKKDAQTGNVLAGAKFKVAHADGTQFAKFTTNSKGEHAFAGWTTEELATEIASNESGELFVIGLLKGDYNLKETATPSEKYVLIEGNIAFAVTEDYKTQTGQTILNHAKGLLPSTGGSGIYGFLIVGGLMMAGSLIWFKRSNRKETDF